MDRSWFACLAVLFAVAPAAGQDEKPPMKAAVFPVENRGSPLKAEELVGLTDHLAKKLGEGGRFRIVPRADLEAALGGKTCVERGCQIEVGRKLGADFVVSASLGRVGDLCIVNAGLYRVGEAAALRTSSGRGPCRADALLAPLRAVADELGSLDMGEPGPTAEPRTVPSPDGIPEPAPDVEARPMPLGPDGRPTPPEPEVEALPRIIPMPVIPMPVVPDRALALEPERPARRFLSVALVYGHPFVQQEDSADQYQEPDWLLGARISLDWLLGDWFLLGLGFTGLAGGESSLADLALRFGGAFRIGSSLILLVFADAGLGAWMPDESDILAGFSLGAGGQARYMITNHFGLAAEIGAGVLFMNDGYSSLDFWRIHADLCVVLGW